MDSLYDDLGVEPTASAEELHEAYRREARRLHPDVRADDSDPEADEELRRLNAAWHVLGDTTRRRAYDAGAGWDPDFGDDAWGGDPAPRPVRFPWWIVAIAIMIVIFIFTAYAAAPGGAPGGN